MEVLEEYLTIKPEDLWVYNKLQVAALVGHTCGPIGAPVPFPGWYIIKPIVTFVGMGKNARKIWLTPNDDTERYGIPGEMWCEYFFGPHLTIDFYKNDQNLVVLGKKAKNERSIEESKWKSWHKIDLPAKLPQFLKEIHKKYGTINIETIGGNLIEVHIRENPDFVWGNEVAIPVWEGEIISPPEGYRYVESPDYDRLGFYIK